MTESMPVLTLDIRSDWPQSKPPFRHFGKGPSALSLVRQQRSGQQTASKVEFTRIVLAGGVDNPPIWILFSLTSSLPSHELMKGKFHLSQPDYGNDTGVWLTIVTLRMVCAVLQYQRGENRISFQMAFGGTQRFSSSIGFLFELTFVVRSLGGL